MQRHLIFVIIISLVFSFVVSSPDFLMRSENLVSEAEASEGAMSRREKQEQTILQIFTLTFILIFFGTLGGSVGAVLSLKYKLQDGVSKQNFSSGQKHQKSRELFGFYFVILIVIIIFILMIVYPLLTSDFLR
ncbi:MAG: FtsX-like permease family protein [Actinobacteria bacterium]|nr:FtsX-like permease family protein [Actinomycetota bacterium]